MKPTKPRGRPCSFDREQALDAAMKVFWRHGYEGASLSDLTEAMGINKPSLYAAFGDKESLFRQALDRYEKVAGAPARAALAAPTAREMAEKLLQSAVENTTSPHNPHGCLMVTGALAGAKESEGIQHELATRRNDSEQAIRRRLKRAQAEGDLSPETSPADLARYLVTVIRGLGVQAAGGATRAELRRVARMAMRAWPS